MSWSGPYAGLYVSGRTRSCSPDRTTSQAVVWVPWCDPSAGGENRLRLYGIEASNVDYALSFTDATLGCTATSTTDFEPIYDTTLSYYGDDNELNPPLDGDPWEASGGAPWMLVSPPDRRIQYIDSVETTTGGKTSQQFHLRTAAERGGGPLLTSTGVPKFRYFDRFFWIRNDYANTTTPRSIEYGPALVYMDGPDVVALPNGQWLMLLQCYTTPVTSLDGVLVPESGDPIANYGDVRRVCGDHNCSMMDLVCYVADDASFTTGLVGPFRVVDGKDALPDDELPTTLPVKPRLAVGVPAAAVVGSQLFVYYTIDKTLNFDERLGRKNEEVDDEVEPLVPCADGTLGGDAQDSIDEYRAAFNEGDFVRATMDIPFKSGIACKIIALSDIYAFAADPDDAWRSSQDLWDVVDWLYGTETIVPGHQSGRVRVWCEANPVQRATEGWGEGWELFERAMCEVGVIADPSPATCWGSNGFQLSLYFPYTKCMDFGLGGGVWRATAIVAGTIQDVVTGYVTAWLGKDFYVDVAWNDDGSFSSPDRLVDMGDPQTGADHGQYLNPDPIQMDDGSWRVYSGGGLASAFNYTGGTALGIFEGDAEDAGCG